MVVPVIVIDLDEADSPFGHAAGQQGGPGKAAGLVHIRAVKFLGGGGFAGQIRQFRHTALHAEGHFILLDPGVGLRVTDLLVIDLVECFQAIERIAPGRSGNARRVVDIEDGIDPAAETDAGVFARQIPASPEAGGDGLDLFGVGGLGDKHHKGGEVAVGRAQPVGNP